MQPYRRLLGITRNRDGERTEEDARKFPFHWRRRRRDRRMDGVATGTGKKKLERCLGFPSWALYDTAGMGRMGFLFLS